MKLEPIRAQTTALFKAIALRQSTRGDYDGTPLSDEELAQLLRVGSSDRVRLLLIIERWSMEQVLDNAIQDNTGEHGAVGRCSLR